MSKLLSRLFTPCLFLLFCCIPSAAQSSTATLNGTVIDPNSSVVPGVVITLQNDATSLERTATTNESGSFTLPLLPPGTYTITARRDGFTIVKVPGVILNVGDQKAIQIGLKVGDVNATVEVRPDEILVNTSPAVTTTIDRTFVGNLPLNGRSFQSLILLTPGVVLTPTSINTNPGQFSVNGQRTNANYFTVDGVSANIGVSTSSGGSNTRFSQEQAGSVPGLSAIGSTNNLVSVDALEEFKIQTSTYSAEFGREPGGQVQIVTRSGNNQFHGTLFEYLRNEAFDANNWFSNRAGLKKAPLKQNQFGGTFSGPLFLPRFGDGGTGWYNGRNKTFFFFSYEGLRLRLPVTINTLVPSSRLRSLAPSDLKTLLNLFPVPTGPETTDANGPTGLAPFVASYSSPKSLDATSIRIDHKISDKATLFGRYNEAPSSSLNRALALLSGEHILTRTLTLGSTLLLTSKLTNEFRFNYSSNRGRNRTTMDSFGGANPIDPALLISGYSGTGRTVGRLNVFPDFGLTSPALGNFVDSYQRQFNLIDSVSLVRGSHNLKLGIDYRRLAPIYGPVEYFQETTFNSQSDILSGTVSQLLIQANKGSQPSFDNFSTYLQDLWKPSRRLTVDLGLRWELNPAPRDANGLKPVTVVGVENLPAATLAQPGSPFFKTFYTAFAPRLGIAYQLRGKKGKELVARGGFGVYYDLGNGQAAAGFGGLPFVASSFQFNVPYPIAPATAVPPPFPTVSLPITSTLFAIDPNLKLPYTLQWNLALEQSIGANQTLSVSYVGAAARQLLTTQSINQRVGNPNTGPRPNPNFGPINYTNNGPSSDYHSLQAQFQRRLSSGLQAVLSYTWSHAIDSVSNEVQTGVLDLGNADFDVRHNFKAGVTYNIPNLNSFLPYFFKDWSLDSIVFAQTGLPLNLSAGTLLRSDGTSVSVRPDLVLGVPIWLDDPAAPGGRRINRAAFLLPPTIPGSTTFFARQGTLGRNVVRSPGFYQVNLALRRQFKFGERWNLQLKAEAFNLFNRPIFGGYNNNVRIASTFGLATTTLNSSLSNGGLSSLYQIGGPRSMQFSLRLSF